MIRRPPRSTLSSSSAASDVYKRQVSTQSTGGSQDKMRLRCKVALVGDAMVGKTSLVAMFGSKGGNEFRKNYQMTIGAEVNFQEVVVPDSEPPTVVELFLFDTSGQDMYKPMAAKHVRLFPSYRVSIVRSAEAGGMSVGCLICHLVGVRCHQPTIVPQPREMAGYVLQRESWAASARGCGGK
eukprot:TRINITY_DN10129_c0_g1_i2.p1 TRINITY_DN10129_c0_g1~~TRINITY_DN10129_c0_g1_i2.p1  ORF type:complete len:182 (-),score=36.05 TRINITY_DN10129_c0_g1_i2:827-1372(-)